ncbi:CBD9-like protein [Phialemonium atrogriseum]|uniref:CBD9-like protein n=1 Tax=Phialemonium atrogriseum TaxID=1093897 RepID=A0AAJ0FIK6_9PEZI|nr:CBD9-like protein [Phialemonium atrogriseum]KAK1764473.1 CBD9-like protein [Phialemonium atrogriseum]
MHWRFAVAWVAATSGLASAKAQAGTTVYQDSLTGFTFSQSVVSYDLDGHVVTYRLALPTGASSSGNYDIVLQVVAPTIIGWAGLAWNGGMTSNPLTVAWKNGNSVTISSRWASSRDVPTAYAGATYQLLKRGTVVNSTHWQYTVKCTGCTQWGTKSLSPTGSHRLAMAAAPQGPSNPASNTSSFPVHTVHYYWDHDFSQAANPSFSSLVTQNGGTATAQFAETIEQSAEDDGSKMAERWEA